MDSVNLTTFIQNSNILYSNVSEFSAMSDTAVENRIMSPHNTNMEKKDSAYKRVC